MKRIVVMAISLLITAPNLVGQSLVIGPTKVSYRRKGKNCSDYKRNFDVRYPTIGTKMSTSVRRRLLSNLDYWKVFDWEGNSFSLQDEIKDDCWVDSLDYEVKYNSHGILDIWLTMEGSGAYPDSSTKYIVSDIQTGRRLTIADLFYKSQLLTLRNLIRSKMRTMESALDQELKELLSEMRENQAESYPPPERLELKNLDGFSISDRGVTFIYNYDYPHVAKAEEPSGEFFIPYALLKPLIRRDGLLARFIR